MSYNAIQHVGTMASGRHLSTIRNYSSASFGSPTLTNKSRALLGFDPWIEESNHYAAVKLGSSCNKLAARRGSFDSVCFKEGDQFV